MLILIRGIPGSGKSTYAKKMYPNALHLENDMFHYHNGKYEFDLKRQDEATKWCLETARNALELGMDVVVSNTFTKRKYINAYKKVADLFGHQFKVIRLNNDFGDIHNVPKFIKEGMKKGFEDYEGEESILTIEV